MHASARPPAPDRSARRRGFLLAGLGMLAGAKPPDAVAEPAMGFPKVPLPMAPGPDLQMLARRHARGLAQGMASAQRASLYLFVSRSLPAASLQRALRDAARAQIVVVMRGFQADSIAQTRQWLQGLGTAGAGIEIDPALFTRFRITQVPALVLARPVDEAELDAQGCAPAPSYRAVQGDVSLDHALTWLQDRGGDPALAAALTRLKATP